MSVIIGIDPHKLLHVACAIDEHETELARLEVRTISSQAADLLAQQLVSRGEHVVDVLATWSSRVRLLGSGRLTKNDANDARAVAELVPGGIRKGIVVKQAEQILVEIIPTSAPRGTSNGSLPR